MPKAPIKNREAIFFRIRGSGNSGDSDRNQLLKASEWNVVTTDLGTIGLYTSAGNAVAVTLTGSCGCP